MPRAYRTSPTQPKPDRNPHNSHKRDRHTQIPIKCDRHTQKPNAIALSKNQNMIALLKTSYTRSHPPKHNQNTIAIYKYHKRDRTSRNKQKAIAIPNTTNVIAISHKPNKRDRYFQKSQPLAISLFIKIPRLIYSGKPAGVIHCG
ncbi:MAG: hypothetical protein HC785_30690 [Calothrix sp. CSU_2_0]|nr:hypothetical protein [Calothrix sp. CSU_2_0]